MNEYTLSANAKVNLTLDVVGRLENGYHLLEMVMQSISLHDTVTLKKNDCGKIRLTCNIPEIPCDERNIAWRCADSFFQYCGIQDGVDIHIEKRIPSQAGLGGGSADGAAVFVGLNKLFDTNLSEQTLCELGVKIGADIPFCICGGTKLCTGIGEIMIPVAAMPDCTILLCKPQLNVNTGEAYRAIDNGSIEKHPDNTAMCKALEESNVPAIGNALCNVFESALPLPVVEEIKSILLSHGALGACMSGSGSTVFGIYSDAAAAARCAELLKETYSDVYLATPKKVGVEF